MVIVTSCGAIFQWPIGYISDKIDRRIILISVTLIASGLSLFIVVSSYISLIIFFTRTLEVIKYSDKFISLTSSKYSSPR